MNECFGAYSKLSDKCSKCMEKEQCKNKRMELCGYKIPNVLNCMPNSAMPISTGHEYRNMKIAENTIATIDLNKIKEEIAESILPNFLEE